MNVGNGQLGNSGLMNSEAEEKNIPIFVHSQIVNPIGFERVKDPLLTPVVEYVFDVFGPVADNPSLPVHVYVYPVVPPVADADQ